MSTKNKFRLCLKAGDVSRRGTDRALPLPPASRDAKSPASGRPLGGAGGARRTAPGEPGSEGGNSQGQRDIHVPGGGGADRLGAPGRRATGAAWVSAWPGPVSCADQSWVGPAGDAGQHISPEMSAAWELLFWGLRPWLQVTRARGWGAPLPVSAGRAAPAAPVGRASVTPTWASAGPSRGGCVGPSRAHPTAGWAGTRAQRRGNDSASPRWRQGPSGPVRKAAGDPPRTSGRSRCSPGLRAAALETARPEA